MYITFGFSLVKRHSLFDCLRGYGSLGLTTDDDININRSPFIYFFSLSPYMECRFTQELKQKIQKDARDHQFQKKSKISKRDKDDVLEERKMISVQVGPSVFSKPVLLLFFFFSHVLKSLF